MMIVTTERSIIEKCLVEARKMKLDDDYIPKGPFDFGENNSIGLHLKTIKHESDGSRGFGLYLGKHVVALKDTVNRIVGLEIYDTHQDLINVWRLD